MKTTQIKIEFPNKYSTTEIVDAILGQIDIQSLNRLGVKIHREPELYSWFN